MLVTRVCFQAMFLFSVVAVVGCGSSAETGVTTVPDEAPVVLTPEEEAGEIESHMPTGEE